MPYNFEFREKLGTKFYSHLIGRSPTIILDGRRKPKTVESRRVLLHSRHIFFAHKSDDIELGSKETEYYGFVNEQLLYCYWIVQMQVSSVMDSFSCLSDSVLDELFSSSCL
jgi:hypothetical protein